MDDDDYYPPMRIEHAVNMLQLNPNALCAGSSVIHVYFKHIQKIVEFVLMVKIMQQQGLLHFEDTIRQSCYDNDACLAEEKKVFTKLYNTVCSIKS